MSRSSRACCLALVLCGGLYGRWAEAAAPRWSVANDGTVAFVGADAAAWQGPMPAIATYWDAKAAVRTTNITPAAGWTIAPAPTARGLALDCRHAGLGLSLHIDLTAAGDVATASVPAAAIGEAGPAKLKTLRLLPRFGAAVEGDEGYLVVAQQSGALCHFRDKAAGEHWVSVYQSTCQCPMPLFGVVRPTGSIAAIVTGGQFDARFCVSTNFGPRRQYAIDPGFNLRTAAGDARLAEDATVEYHFLGAGTGWVDIGKRYRLYNAQRRNLKPLVERAAESPELKYSAGALEVRIRLGVKPVPSPVPAQTPENEPALRVFCDFARVAEIFEEFHRQGIGQVEFCLVGWNRGGHDGRFPQLFPVEPALSGEEGLKKTIARGQSLGYQIVAHDCYYDAYQISEDWNEDILRKLPDGQPQKGGIWGGGQSYNVCLAVADERFAGRNFAQTRALGFRGAHYSDVLSIIGPRPCYDPRHPQTRRQDAEATNRILARARKVFGGVQSEGALDFTAPVLDRALYVDCDKWLPLAKRPYVDRCVPLFEIAYHGVMLYNLSTETVNVLPGESGYLKNIEYGGAPLAYFYGHFVLEKEKNWLGSRDYRYDDAAQLKRSVAELKTVYDDYRRLAHLQYVSMEGHAPLAEGVSRTTYGNGESVVVNHTQSAYSLPSGQSVPARGFALLKK